MTVRLLDLQTPSAIVFRDIVERNTARMAARARELGVALRPHVKTHKCLAAAQLQVRGHFGGITVSTLAEARHFAQGGFRDITYAVPLAPQKAPLVAELAPTIERLGVLVDSGEAIDALEAESLRSGHVFAVQLKIDCGSGRAGVDADGDAAPRLARRLVDSPATTFEGILAHGGQTYSARTRDEVLAGARAERDVTVGVAERLAAAGTPAGVVSVGSTPGMCVIDSLAGVSEVRPGNYAFFDDDQLWLGSCEPQDRAFAVLATVIGVHPSRGSAVIDAGALALSKDPGPTHVAGFPGGYGSVADPATAAPMGDLRLATLSQEHGVLHGNATSALRVGQKLLIFPNHSCLCAACFDEYCVVRGEDVVDAWRPVRGW